MEPTKSIDEHILEILQLLKNEENSEEDWSVIDSFASKYEPKEEFKYYKKEHKQKLVNEDLMVLLIARTKTEKLQHRLSTLLKLIRIFSRLDRNIDIGVREGGIEFIIELIKDTSSEPSVVAEACAALQNLALLETNLPRITSQDGIRLIIDAMKRYPLHANVQKKACGVLQNLAINDANKVTIHQAEGIKLIINAMKSYEMNADVQLNACGALMNLALNDDNLEEITNEAGIKYIIAALKNHSQKAGVQKYACAALWNLSVKDNNKTSIAEQNGIELIILAMKNHEKKAGVQHNACGALWNLAMDDSNRATIAALEGIKYIILAMQNHPKNTDIQNSALGTLQNLAINEENKKVIANENGLNFIIKAMQEHEKDPDIQQIACGALQNLALNDNNIDLLNNLNGIELILTTMKNHVQKVSVQQYACAVLWNISVKEETKKAIGEKSGIPIILSAMRMHEHPDLQKHACGVLRNLALNKENCTIIAENGGIECIIAAMNNYIDNIDLQVQACATLRNLANDHPENKTIIVSRGGLTVLRKILDEHKSVPKVKRYADGAFSNLNKNIPELVDRLENIDQEKKLQVAIELPYCTKDVADKKYVFVKKKWLLVLLSTLSAYPSLPGPALASLLYLIAPLHLTQKITSSQSLFLSSTPPSFRLLKSSLEFAEFINDAKVSDVTFIVEGRPIFACRLILVARSDYFRKLLLLGLRESQQQDIHIEDIELDYFLKIITFLYTYQIEIVSSDEAIQLLIAADRYQLEELKQLCEYYLSPYLDQDTVVCFFELAVRFNGSLLKKYCLNWVLKNLEERDLESGSSGSISASIEKMLKMDNIADQFFEFLSPFFDDLGD